MIPSDLRAAQKAEEDLIREVARQGYSEAAIFAIKLAVEEALNNAIRHGNAGDPNRKVSFSYHVRPDRAAITVSDEGHGFDPDDLPDPTADENLEKPCGRGIMLIRAYMDEVRFNPRGNQVHMIKHNR